MKTPGKISLPFVTEEPVHEACWYTKALDGVCEACDEERSDQVAQDEAMRRYVEDYRAEFGDDAVLFDPFAGEFGD